MSQSAPLLAIIKQFATPKELDWVISFTNAPITSIQRAFVATPRFIAKTPITDVACVDEVDVNSWTLDQLVRVYILTSLDSTNKEVYTKTIDTLFETAENKEAVALMSALPFLSYPDYWLLRATDAVRSNIGLVFDAIAFNNPYPKNHFSELAWNQLILKCIFNDKPINQILGLEERANATLAQSISDLAHERWAAGRTIPSEAWLLVSKFMNESILKDIEKLLQSAQPQDIEIAQWLCQNTDYQSAKKLLENHVR